MWRCQLFALTWSRVRQMFNYNIANCFNCNAAQKETAKSSDRNRIKLYKRDLALSTFTLDFLLEWQMREMTQILD